ncbi:MAG: hypothetical protein ACQ5SW_04300 [Sphaerochaetaceae bacterium]
MPVGHLLPHYPRKTVTFREQGTTFLDHPSCFTIKQCGSGGRLPLGI